MTPIPSEHGGEGRRALERELRSIARSCFKPTAPGRKSVLEAADFIAALSDREEEGTVSVSLTRKEAKTEAMILRQVVERIQDQFPGYAVDLHDLARRFDAALSPAPGEDTTQVDEKAEASTGGPNSCEPSDRERQEVGGRLRSYAASAGGGGAAGSLFPSYSRDTLNRAANLLSQSSTDGEAAVEAVAKRLARLYSEAEEDRPNAFAKSSPSVQNEWRADARAVLAVARPPTDGLRERLTSKEAVQAVALELEEELQREMAYGLGLEPATRVAQKLLLAALDAIEGEGG